MAQKIPKRPKPAAPAPAADEVNELEVLHPDRSVVLGKRVVKVREYRHLEWLRLLQQAEPLVAAIAKGLEARQAPTYEDALAVLAANADVLLPLVAQAADMTVQEVENLNPNDGELLLMTWWGVNFRFFAQRAVNRLAIPEAARQLAAQAAASAGARSTPS